MIEMPYRSATQSASTSTNHSRLMKPFISTKVVAGRIAAKTSLVRTGSGFPLRDIGQHDSCPHHTVDGKASVHHSIRDDLKATSRLAIDAAWTSYASVCRDRRSA